MLLHQRSLAELRSELGLAIFVASFYLNVKKMRVEYNYG